VEETQFKMSLLLYELKLGWIIWKIVEYLSVNRCFKCSRYNYSARECMGHETFPLGAGRNRWIDCTVSPQEYKCVNCLTFTKFKTTKSVCPKNSSLDNKCYSIQAFMEKNRQNTNY